MLTTPSHLSTHLPHPLYHLSFLTLQSRGGGGVARRPEVRSDCPQECKRERSAACTGPELLLADWRSPSICRLPPAHLSPSSPSLPQQSNGRLEVTSKVTIIAAMCHVTTPHRRQVCGAVREVCKLSSGKPTGATFGHVTQSATKSVSSVVGGEVGGRNINYLSPATRRRRQRPAPSLMSVWCNMAGVARGR